MYEQANECDNLTLIKKPLISYYGGKQRIASKIIPHLEAIPHTVRAIPFAGGLGVETEWERPSVTNNDHYCVAINDTDEQLINLYRVARDQPDALHHKITGTPYSQSEHQLSIHIYKNPTDYDDVTRAWAYFVNAQMSFANKLNGGWGTAVYGRNKPATWCNKLNRLSDVLKRFKDVYIGCEDALKFIERWDSPQTLFYLDPPYPSANQGHYDGYTLSDFKALCDLLDHIDGSYVLSNYPQSVEPQSAQKRIEIKAHCSASGQGKVGKDRDKSKAATKDELGDRARTEVLWICDRSDSIQRHDLRKVLNMDEASQPHQSEPTTQQLSLL